MNSERRIGGKIDVAFKEDPECINVSPVVNANCAAMHMTLGMGAVKNGLHNGVPGKGTFVLDGSGRDLYHPRLCSLSWVKSPSNEVV
jgi:hypothetical protein